MFLRMECYGRKQTSFAWVIAFLAVTLFSPIALQAQGSKGIVYLLVDKVNNRAELRSLEANGKNSKLINSFAINLGSSGGAKLRQGDKRTPEGIYLVQNRWNNSRSKKM